MKAVIFDLDGVLVFTDRFHFQAWKRIADELGIRFDGEQNNRLRGVGRMESLEILLGGYAGKPLCPEEKKAFAEKKNKIYRSFLKTMTPEDVAAGVWDTLSELRRRGYGLAVGSSSKNARFILERTGLLTAFDGISDGCGLSRAKPDPEVFLRAAGILNCEPGDCLVVEDAVAGIEAGAAGGMKTAAIGGAADCGRADYRQADYRLEKLADLLGILL